MVNKYVGVSWSQRFSSNFLCGSITAVSCGEKSREEENQEKPVIPWVTKAFFLTQGAQKYFASLRLAAGTSSKAVRKTFGTEGSHSLFSLNFDQF